MRLKSWMLLPLFLMIMNLAHAQPPASFPVPLQNILQPFSTDGCSKFPDGIPLSNPTLWRHCCIEHDVAYWQGGTADQREKADEALNQCVSVAAGRFLGISMYLGVRFGGQAGFPTSWHWGYGWKLERGYSPLRPDEQKQVDHLIKGIPKDLTQLPIVSSAVNRQRESITGDLCLDQAVIKIQQQLGRSFVIRNMQETPIKERADGWWKNMQILTDGCQEPFIMTFQLLKPKACKSSLSEFVARGQIRLQRFSAPNCY
jgi:hypothetical protein